MTSERGAKYELKIVKGKTFARTLRAAARPYIYKAITGITKAAPARVTCPSHAIPDGWPVAVVSVQGMRQIRAENDPPKGSDFTQATVVDANTIELNAVNSAEFSTYTSGGYLQLFTPTDLSGAVARLKVWDRPDGTLLLELSSPSDGIVLSNTTKTITITIAADDTADLDWIRGVYEAQLELRGDVVVPLASGTVTVEAEA